MRQPENIPIPASFSRDQLQTVGDIFVENPRIQCRNVDVYYGEKHAIQDVNLDVGRNEVIALICAVFKALTCSVFKLETFVALNACI